MCRCRKMLLAAANEGTCLWCGHGDIAVPTSSARRAVRLPRDLGALAREGRRADPHAENVIPINRAFGAGETGQRRAAA